VNLAIQVKLWWDVNQSGVHPSSVGTWSEVVKWWDVMVQDEQYKDICRAHFADALTGPQKGQKRKAAQELLLRRPLQFASRPARVDNTSEAFQSSGPVEATSFMSPDGAGEENTETGRTAGQR
jgi:hypothetical protein